MRNEVVLDGQRLAVQKFFVSDGAPWSSPGGTVAIETNPAFSGHANWRVPRDIDVLRSVSPAVKKLMTRERFWRAYSKSGDDLMDMLLPKRQPPPALS